MTYSEKLKDPRWQKKRLEILQSFEFTCSFCGSKEKTLHVHHGYYKRGLMPWEYPDEAYHCLCFECHEIRANTEDEIKYHLSTFSCRELEKFMSVFCATLAMGVEAMAESVNEIMYPSEGELK